MKRTQTKFQLSETNFAHKIRYTFSSPEDAKSRKQSAYDILTQLASSPGLLDAGPVFFQSMKMQWAGDSWVVEIEGVE